VKLKEDKEQYLETEMDVVKINIIGQTGRSEEAELYLSSGLIKYSNGEWSHLQYEKTMLKTIMPFEESKASLTSECEQVTLPKTHRKGAKNERKATHKRVPDSEC
jgi:hypothetical protein